MGLFSKKTKVADEAQIDLRAETTIDLTKADAPSKIEWGFPTRCPDCGEHGYLDRIDVVHEVMYQHCPSCWVKWETPRSETADA